MKIINRIQSWPDKKKKTFSVVTAIFLTLAIVGLWYWFYFEKINNGPSYKSDLPSPLDKSLEDIKNSFNTATEQFSSATDFIKSQLASSTEFNATTTSASSSAASTSSKNTKK